MKKIIFIILSSVLILSSCEKWMEVTPQDSQVAENYYVSETAVRANTASLYGKAWWNFQCQFMWLAGDMLAGDLYYTYDQEGHFFYNKVGAGNSYNNNGWLGLYNVVSFANSIINDMPTVALGNGVSQAVIDKAIAEARCIRAAAYMFLVEYWGAIPIIENSTELISTNNIQVPRHIQKDVYTFICNDLEYAAANLPATDEAGRATCWTAKGLLAKAYLQRAAYHISLADGQADTFYGKAKEYAADVIENSGLAIQPDYGTLFDVSANNNPESLLAIQCMKGEYGDGSSRNVNWSRGKRIAEQTWGAGKGPTRSLQKLFFGDERNPVDNDLRRKWIFMTEVNDVFDTYDMLAKDEGGYAYQYVYRDPADVEVTVEASNSMLAHVKKYIIGKPSDCDNNVGQNQDAGNNIYLLRLADVYMVYVEACMGSASSTSDVTAIGYLNTVLDRAGYQWTESEITFDQLIQERRKEFAMESINWLDIKRMYYRNSAAAIEYMNGMERDKTYSFDWSLNTGSITTEELYSLEVKKSSWLDSWETLSDTEDNSSRVNNIVFTDASFFIPIPSAVTTQAPILNEEPVPYYDTNE